MWLYLGTGKRGQAQATGVSWWVSESLWGTETARCPQPKEHGWGSPAWVPDGAHGGGCPAPAALMGPMGASEGVRWLFPGSWLPGGACRSSGRKGAELRHRQGLAPVPQIHPCRFWGPRRWLFRHAGCAGQADRVGMSFGAHTWGKIQTAWVSYIPVLLA